MSPVEAAEAASGWGGDAEILLLDRAGGRAAFAWRLRFDAGVGVDHVARSFSAVARGLQSVPGAGKVSQATFSCRERPDRGPIAVSHSGADLLFLLGPAHIEGAKWGRAGDCALARKWSQEILGG
jgi:hypothetical protein